MTDNEAMILIALLSLLVTVVLASGAWFFKRLDNSLCQLASSVSELTIKVAVLREKQDRWEDHEARIRELEKAK